MTLEVDFLPFATGSGANVDSQSDWATNSVVTNGFQSGITLSILMNKALRQGTVGAAILANFIAQVTQTNVLDNGSINTVVVQLWLAVLQSESFVDAGAANTIVVNEPSGFSFPSPTKGIKATIQIIANNTGATTLNWMGNGAVAVKTQAGAALSANAIIAGGYYTFVFDGTEWQLLA